MEQPKHTLARATVCPFQDHAKVRFHPNTLTLRRLQAVTRLSFLLRLASTALGK